MNPRDRAILDALTKAAANGDICPSNSELAIVIGSSSISTPVTAMQSLERNGLIHVARGNNSRVVTITATGQSTAGVKPRPHWRTRPEHLPRKSRLAELIANGRTFADAGIIMHRSRAEITQLWAEVRADMGWQAQ